ncbi:Uncharacterized protein QTN25_002497 [Entamoeba marina]
MSQFLDESYSQLFFGNNFSNDSESSFIGERQMVTEYNESSQSQILFKKRTGVRLPKKNNYITCYENDIGGPIESFSFSNYLQLLSKKKHLIDCNVVLLLFDNLAKGSFKIFVNFMLDILPTTLSQFSIKVFHNCVIENPTFLKYLTTNVNLSILYEESLKQQNIALLQFFLLLKPLPIDDCIERGFKLIELLYSNPTKTTMIFTVYFIQKVIENDIANEELVTTYSLVLLSVYLNQPTILHYSIQALLTLSEGKYKQTFLNALNYFRLPQLLTLDQQHFLNFFLEGKSDNEYQFDNIAYHTDLQFIILNIEKLYARTSYGRVIVIGNAIDLPLTIPQLFSISQKLLSQTDNIIQTLKCLQVVLTELIYSTNPLSQDFLYAEKSIYVVFEILENLLKIEGDEFEIHYLKFEVCFLDLLLINNLSSTFPFFEINAQQKLFFIYDSLKDDLNLSCLCFTCMSLSNYYRPLFTDDTLDILVARCVDLYFQNDEFVFDVIIPEQLYQRHPSLVHLQSQFLSPYTIPLLRCIDYIMITKNVLEIYLNFLEKCQMQCDEAKGNGKVKKKDIIDYIKLHNPLLSLEIIMTLIANSAEINDRLSYRSDRVQLKALTNNAKELCSDIINLISLPFVENNEFFEEVRQIEKKLEEVYTTVPIVIDFIASKYMKLSVPEKKAEIDVISKMRSDIEKKEMMN